MAEINPDAFVSPSPSYRSTVKNLIAVDIRKGRGLDRQGRTRLIRWLAGYQGRQNKAE